MSLMEKFADPSLFDSLGFGDKMMGSLITMIMGMGITFAVLLLLWGFVAIMGKCISMSDRKEKKDTEKTAAVSVQQGAQASSDVSGASGISGDEVIAAVIAAAVAAYRSEGGTGELMVRKITRLSGESTAWSNAAIEDCIESRRF